MKTLILSLSLLIIASFNLMTENIDSSSMKIASQIEIESKIDVEKSNVTEKTYFLNDIEVKLTQIKNNGREFYCKSMLLISKNNKVIDSLKFNPEPVGGYYGISKPIEIDNHLIFTKHGDYDGRTIIINSKGQIFNIIGGKNYYDSEKKLLFTIYESDLSGIAVFDLNIDLLKFKKQEIEDWPISFHKAFGDRYFIICNNDSPKENNTTIWEIEFELDRIMQVELNSNEINQSNILKTWKMEEVKCECEK